MVVLSFSTVFFGVLGLACGLAAIVLVPIVVLAFVGALVRVIGNRLMKRELKKLMREGGDAK